MRTTFVLVVALGAGVVTPHGVPAQTADRLQPAMPSASVAAVQEGQALRRSGQPAEAAAKLVEVVKQQPDYFNARYVYGLALAESGDFEKASAAFTVAVKIREDRGIGDYTIYNSLGWSQLIEGRYDDAIRSLEIAARNIDRLPPVSRGRTLNNLGLAYEAKGDVEKAKNTFARANREFNNANAERNLRRLEQQANE